MKCVKCHAEIEQDAQFCPYCGTKVEHIRCCVKCGKPLDDDSDFCPYCGTRQDDVVVEPEQVEEVHSQEPELVQKELAPTPVVVEQPQEPEIVQEEPEPKPVVVEQPQEPEEKKVESEPPSNSVQEETVDTIQPFVSKPTSKKWLWIIGAIILLGILGGCGYYFMKNKGNGLFYVKTDSNAEVGTLTVYYAKEEIKVEKHGCEKGKLYYDSNNCDVRFKSDDDNYIFECDVDDYDGVGVETWSIPKSKIEKKTYKMYQLSAKEIGSKAVFESDKGCTARIFWSNINGHKYYSWDGKDVNWNETSRYKECYVLSAELMSEEYGEKYPFEIQLDESQGYFKLYNKTSVLGKEVLIGKLEASWRNEEGWDYKKSAYSADGKLLADQWEIDGIPDELSIAYLAEENALYINGDIYYRK